MPAYDYIIIGAGLGRCVLANRLSEDPSCVSFVEAGPRDMASLHPHAGRPGQAGRQEGRQLGLRDRTRAAVETRRLLWWPRGKVLGGSSSINAMCYVRGVPAD